MRIDQAVDTMIERGSSSSLVFLTKRGSMFPIQFGTILDSSANLGPQPEKNLILLVIVCCCINLIPSYLAFACKIYYFPYFLHCRRPCE